jgi:glycoside hydrolase-like protein
VAAIYRTLRAVVPTRPGAAGQQPRHGRSRWWRPALGGLLAATVAGVTAVALLSGWLVPVPSREGIFKLASAPAPRGWHSVSYQGVRLSVPPTWPIVNLSTHPNACPRLDVHAVYLGKPGPHPLCPASGVGAETEAVQISPAVADNPHVVGATKAATIGGARAMTNRYGGAGHTITDVFPGVRAQVELTYGTDKALIQRVQATIEVAHRQVAGKRFAPARVAAATSAGLAQGLVKGAGFDTCSTPSLSTMRAWLSSRYRSIGVYIGGADMACAQPNLTASWINSVERRGWHVFPLYVGPQAPCVNAPGNLTFSPGNAGPAGTAAAGDAAAQARHLGFPRGTPVIYDMEAYSGCGAAVVHFVNSWDRKLRASGFGSGLYESSGNVGDLFSNRGWMSEPEVLFYANWDGRYTTNSPYIPHNMWAHHQRIHQYIGNVTQTFGGVSLGIDEDRLTVNLGGGGARSVTVHGRPQSAIVDRGGTVRLYDRGSGGGALWEDHLPATAGSPWTWFNMKGKWPTTPTAVAASDGTVYVLSVGTDGHLHERHLPKGGRWTSWKSRGGHWLWSPAAVAGPSGTIRIFLVGSNGHLYQKRLRSNGTWSSWIKVGSSNLTGTPAATIGSGGTVRVYVRSAAASHTMRVATLVGSKPWAWQNLHGIWRWDPAAVAQSHGTARVFAVGTDRRLYQKRLRPSGRWSSWMRVGLSHLTGAPTAAIDKTGVVRVFTRVTTGSIKEKQLAPGGAPWSQVNLHGDWKFDPSAVVSGSNIVRVYAMGTGGAIWEDHLRVGRAWSGWFRLGGP